MQDYSALSPDFVLDAIESLGYLSDLRVLALNSYENRVYQIGIEESTPLIAKFYRPSRWSDEQILEEHRFALELADLEVPVIPPIEINGETLHHYKNHRFSIYERKGGHAPDLSDLDSLYTLGQHLGRVHAVGAKKEFIARPHLNLKNFGLTPKQFLLNNNFIPRSILEAYTSLTDHLFEEVDKAFSEVSFVSIRLHGDCHPGNIITRPDSLYLVDLDDARNGPAIQDIWMLLSGDDQSKRSQLSTVAEGYEEFFELDYKEFRLIEALRTLRLIHYAGWLASRWTDPAFPLAFPWFNTEKYWAEHVLQLREQLAEMQAPPLSIQ